MALTKSNQSAEKTIRIIESLARASQPMRLSDLAKEVDMPSSTVLRMLMTLEDMGYAYQEEEGLRRYGLTGRFLYLGQLISAQNSMQHIVHPFLKKVTGQLGEMSCVAMMDQGKLRYIDVVESTQNRIVIRQRIGGSAPMHCTGSGKLFLMQLSAPELDDYIARDGLPAHTPHTLTSRPALARELEKCRANGYAIDDEECELGMRCVAAPIFNLQGEVRAAISVSGPAARMPSVRMETEIIPLLCATARRITEKVTGQKSDGE